MLLPLLLALLLMATHVAFENAFVYPVCCFGFWLLFVAAAKYEKPANFYTLVVSLRGAPTYKKQVF